MNVNVLSHRTSLADKPFEIEANEQILYGEKFPGLNPTESFENYLGKAFAQIYPPPINIKVRKNTLFEKWSITPLIELTTFLPASNQVVMYGHQSVITYYI
ncbi:hypothetical protein NPIL_328251 [Nephila pilipes]|uniref:Uncharacterized protein n=1 Tax=Nephila pilipes TaxID=299642 RepID=A0A8X6TQ37_NEPPI|nr:hypothetical protein NPIL_328251 [Nephila pilipes]